MSKAIKHVLQTYKRDVLRFNGFCTSTNGSTTLTNEANTADATVTKATNKITVTFPTFFTKYYGGEAQLNVASGYAGRVARIDSFTAKDNTTGLAILVIGLYDNAAGAYAAADNTGDITWAVTVRE